MLEDGVDGGPGALDEPGLVELGFWGGVGVVAGCVRGSWEEKEMVEGGSGGGGGLPAVPSVTDGVIVQAAMGKGPRREEGEPR